MLASLSQVLQVQAKPIKAFAYQPHTEDYGKLLSAYVKNKKVG